jgi:hypothetical protein
MRTSEPAGPLRAKRERPHRADVDAKRNHIQTVDARRDWRAISGPPVGRRRHAVRIVDPQQLPRIAGFLRQVDIPDQ